MPCPYRKNSSSQPELDLILNYSFLTLNSSPFLTTSPTVQIIRCHHPLPNCGNTKNHPHRNPKTKTTANKSSVAIIRCHHPLPNYGNRKNHPHRNPKTKTTANKSSVAIIRCHHPLPNCGNRKNHPHRNPKTKTISNKSSAAKCKPILKN